MPDDPVSDDPVMVALARKVPITLLCDLLDPSGPRSREIHAAEREEDEGWWLELAFPAGPGATPYPPSSV